ncbi:MAG: hypothetical protein QM755_08070 [Luteolibacter sp.]
MKARSFYNSLLSEFNRRGRNSKFKVTVSPIRTSDNEVWLEEGLKLAATASSCRGLGKAANSFVIYVMPRERFSDPKGYHIESSTVEVAYVKLDSGSRKGKLVMGFHYDFDTDTASGDPKALHPICHAQISRKLMQLKGIMAKEYDIDAQGDELPDVRVPTAHISLTSCLLGISADHFTSTEHAGFLNWLRLQSEFPRMENANFVTRLEKCQLALRSCAWYG